MLSRIAMHLGGGGNFHLLNAFEPSSPGYFSLFEEGYRRRDTEEKRHPGDVIRRVILFPDKTELRRIESKVLETDASSKFFSSNKESYVYSGILTNRGTRRRGEVL